MTALPAVARGGADERVKGDPRGPNNPVCLEASLPICCRSAIDGPAFAR